MIKSDFGKVTFKGNKPLLMTELCSIVKAFIKEEVIDDKEELYHVIEETMKTDEEVHEEFKNKNLSSKDMQELAIALAEARKSGLVKEKQAEIETILDNDNFKVQKIELNTKGKTRNEVGQELDSLLKKTI